ncbi:MAG: nuclear transport factor 2 family protein [Myxococcota bacterium]|nr:nuclear transport factor 2 family protein [Myxococcota bacterium]
MARRELSIREISDRLQIQDLLVRYTRAIDTKDWNLLDTCFTPDAQVDYTATGGIAGGYPEVRTWLAKALARFPITVHYITNSQVTLDGDRARARTLVLNPMFHAEPDGTLRDFTVGATYVDELLWTEAGWRITRRAEEAGYLRGALPEALRSPQK